MASTINASTSNGLVTTADTSGVLTLQSSNANVVNIDATSGNPRITGDFSNATVPSRLMFQTSTTNSATTVGVIPNGTNLSAQITAYNNSDPTNSSRIYMTVNAAEAQIGSTIVGTGSYLPITFHAGGFERLRIDTSTGNILNTGGGGLGYGTGSGGTVTQATSRTTAVTLNKPTGQITTFASALAANASATFQVNNSTVAVGDTVVVAHCSGGTVGNYFARIYGVGAGLFYINLANISAGSLTDAAVVTFTVIKGASS